MPTVSKRTQSPIDNHLIQRMNEFAMGLFLFPPPHRCPYTLKAITKNTTMKFLFLLVTIITCVNSNAQTLEGKWKGSLQAGPQKLTLVMNIDQAGKSVTMDVVEQGASKLPMTVGWLSEDSINVSIPQLGLCYEGKLKDNTLDGTFRQQTFATALSFTKGEATYNRPQEPKAPFPYETEEITFANEDLSATLSGTLTYPTNYQKGKGVVVLMVTGSGAQNRDEEMFHHKPFLVIADHLARHGIASLRYDDRGTAKSTGNFKTVTTKDLASDAQAGINWLRKSGKFAKVGLLGHSEGGLIGYMLGSKGKTDFVVSLAGPACRIDTMMMLQLNALARIQGSPKDIVNNVEETRTLLMKSKTPWMKEFVNSDATAFVKKTKCPVLALGGDKDLNVPVSINVPSLEANLPKNKHNTIKVYKGLSHMFQHTATGNPMEAANTEETMAQEVLSDISQWILEVTRH